MRSLLTIAIAVFIAGCTSQSSYLPLPRVYSSIDEDEANQVFVVEVRPAFDEPVGYRFDYLGPREAFRTKFERHGKPVRERLEGDEAERIRKAWLSFDWNHIEDPLEGGGMVLDDIIVVIRAKVQNAKREGSVELSRSRAVQGLLTELGLLRRREEAEPGATDNPADAQ